MRKEDVIKGLILAGGGSTRMRSDKSLIDYHGKPQREYLFDILQSLTHEVHLSCKREDHVPSSLHPIHDIHDLETPLNGILSAFYHDPDCTWITVPVDMPLVTSDVLLFLLKHRDPAKLATCFLDSEGVNPEPLLTIWERQSYPYLHEYFLKGGISPRGFLQKSKVNLIAPPSPHVLLNVNDEQTLEDFRARTKG